MIDLTNAKPRDWVKLRCGVLTQVKEVTAAVITLNGMDKTGCPQDKDVVELLAGPPLTPDARGWYFFHNMAVKEFGEVTLVCNRHGSYYYGGDKCPEWLDGVSDHDTIAVNIDAVEVAYALHLAELAKPLLVWEDLMLMSTASYKGGRFVVENGGNTNCSATWHYPTAGKHLVVKVTIDQAKEACEQHARELAAQKSR